MSQRRCSCWKSSRPSWMRSRRWPPPNPAKQLAQRLYGCLPVVYGAGIAAEAAHRWKTQINENSKAWAFYEVFPELNHNATVGFPLPKEIAGKVRGILLRSPLFN